MRVFVMDKIKILFVCMGNICRSPTAEGVFGKLIEERGITERFHLDSAGTHAYHIGDAPDFRAQKAARDRDIELRHLRARRIKDSDFAYFDYILAMDKDNYADLLDSCPPEYIDKIQYFLSYAPNAKTLEVPDPYYGGTYGFDQVLDLAEEASLGLYNALKDKGDI